jgi:iron complex transport system permease protein
MAFQALFRNALATPFTLGVSSGASLGAALYVIAGFSAAPAGVSGQSLAAMIGALLAIVLVYGLTRAARDFTSSTLLLAGVAVSFLLTSLLSALAYVGDVSAHLRIGRWLLGGLEVVGFAVVRQLLPFAALGLAGVVLLRRELDLLLLGDDVAAARGVPVGRIKKLLFLGVSLMVGGVVAACGPIGFVGLIVPHVGRRLVGAGHARLAPFCVLGGGAFLVLCDTVGRTALAPVEIPVGLVTSLLGGPFFLALLVRGRAEPSGLDF